MIVDKMIGDGRFSDLAKDFHTCTDLSNTVDIYEVTMINYLLQSCNAY